MSVIAFLACMAGSLLDSRGGGGGGGALSPSMHADGVVVVTPEFKGEVVIVVASIGGVVQAD